MKYTFLAIATVIASLTFGGCASSVDVPDNLQSRLDRDIHRPIDEMNGEELRVHYNDLNNYITLMEVGRTKTDGLERNDYEQYLRLVKPRLGHVEAALLNRGG